MIHFEIPKNQSSIIKVIGVGGGGSNAVNYMHTLGIEGVDFIVCNTDSQALTLSPVHNKVQLGPHLTQGLGAGANPEIGKQACEESFDDISKILEVNTRMAFITAGMGGGTGTGGAPVVAKICKDLGILTVGIVTTPFSYEGRKRMKQAQEGIDRMRDNVDTILIISNDKLRQQYGNLPFTKAFAQADNVLSTAAKCITDVINTTGQINVDFADVCTVMKSGGVAILGSAEVAGENRALEAVEEALNSPLLNDSDIKGAKWILLNITSAAGEFEHTMDEAEAIQAFVQQQAGDDCDVILGMGHDPNLEEKIAVTIIATGFSHKDIDTEMPARSNEPEKIVMTLGQPTTPEAKTETPEQKVETPKEDLFAPKLVEEHKPEERTGPVVIDAKPSFPVSNEPQPEKETMRLVMPDEQHEEQEEEETVSEPEMKDDGLQLVIKNELVEDVVEQQEAQPEPAPTVVFEAPKREMSERELEEKRIFEEQKRALEERAERLRKMSFNIKAEESTDDIENVPAYVRKNMNIDNENVASKDTFYSGYTVSVNDKKDNDEADLRSINTFLDGKKPD
ncbi:MAG: cell division protein FtsZ [Chitinophagales bacterium]|nr:cell division protein FtsZ [Chitinophagaceae bacterium]MCB9063710.1 cell division protein FtsZ [Chitinophagales bacterium]